MSSSFYHDIEPAGVDIPIEHYPSPDPHSVYQGRDVVNYWHQREPTLASFELSRGGGGTVSHQKTTTVWTCCDCGHGPYLWANNTHCADCHHKRCKYCKVQTVRAGEPVQEQAPIPSVASTLAASFPVSTRRRSVPSHIQLETKSSPK